MERFMRLALAMTVALVVSFASQAHAAGPLQWRFPGAYNKQAAIGAYGRAVYPKYTWGFHNRELQNVGVPHGDIGILGSGIQRDPW